MAFEGINFGLATPQTKLKTPQEIQTEALQLQGLRQQTAMGGMSLKHQQQAMQDAQDFNLLAQQTGGDPEAMHTALLKQGKVELAQKLQLWMQEQAKAKATAYQTQQKSLLDFNEAQQAVLSKANASNWDQVQSELKSNADRFAQVTGMAIDTTKNDHPAAFDPQWTKEKIMGLQTSAERLKQQELDLKKQELDLKKQELGNFGGFHPAIGENGKPGIFQSNKAGEVRQVPGLKPVPSQASVNVGLGGGGGLTPEALDLMVERFRKTGDLPAVGQGKAGTQLRMQIINGAASKDKAEGTVTDLAEAKKSFKTQQEAQKFFTTGKGADAMRQQETILHHAKVFQEIADALDNGNIQIANRLGNQFGLQAGSDKATNLKMAGQIFSAEVGKYLAGSMGSAQERQELAELMPMFNSPEQFRGGLKTLSNLVEGQRKSWMRQRTAALSGKVTDESGEAHKTMTLADAKATAAASGKTLNEVIQAAKARGWEVK